MTERIERVTRIKAIDGDVGRKFDGGDYHNARNSAFLAEYLRVLRKRNAVDSAESADAYRLELTNDGIPALFYFGDRDIRGLLN